MGSKKLSLGHSNERSSVIILGEYNPVVRAQSCHQILLRDVSSIKKDVCSIVLSA